jgi:hypothetical protein
MKTSQILIITTILFTIFVTQACDRSSNDLENAETSLIEAERDLEIAQSEIEADVRMFRQEMASEIRENNVAITDIEKKIQDEKADVKAAYEVRIAEFEQENNDLKREIDNYSITDRDSWDDFKDQFSSSMNDLGNSLDDFFSEPTTSIN